jgi:hypothetical protein
MEPFFAIYLTLWIAACAGAVAVCARNPGDMSFLRPGYRRFLLVRWKVATFAAAAAGLTLVAPYTGDPTWDHVDAAFQSVLTFLGAPWAVGTLYLGLRRRSGWKPLYVAACVWLFSACWSYDLYILLRDGRYPDTWLVNVAASSVLYLAAGLLWNLDWRPGRGVTFSFLEREWFALPQGPQFARVLGYALPFMLIAAASAAYFVLTAAHG